MKEKEEEEVEEGTKKDYDQKSGGKGRITPPILKQKGQPFQKKPKKKENGSMPGRSTKGAFSSPPRPLIDGAALRLVVLVCHSLELDTFLDAQVGR